MKLVLQILLVLIIISTISICVLKPELHKNVIVYDSAYTLVAEEQVKTEIKDVPVMEMPAKPIEKTTVVEKNVEPITSIAKTQSKNVQNKVVTKPKQTVSTRQTVVKPQIQTVQKQVKSTPQKPVVKEVVKTVPIKVEQKVTLNTSPQASTTRSEGVSVTPKVYTQQEESIAWNKWRSALTNKIMQDTRLPDVPNGVVFQFSFNVDKFGKITNVQTGANPFNYTPYAIQYIAPVIRSYQGRSILNFPEGTQRMSTQVTGKWRISNTEKYSTPQDYNDIEKVIR